MEEYLFLVIRINIFNIDKNYLLNMMAEVHVDNSMSQLAVFPFLFGG